MAYSPALVRQFTLRTQNLATYFSPHDDVWIMFSLLLWEKCWRWLTRNSLSYRKLTEPLQGGVDSSTAVNTSISANGINVTLKETFLSNSGLTFLCCHVL